MFSQYGQDDYIKERFFKNKNDGYFVNIGANDGVTFDNTLMFENIGWCGVCIEPNPIIYAKLIKNRKCVCYNVCLSNSNGVVDFLKIDGHSEMLSGILECYDPRHLERVDRELSMYGGSKEVIQIESKTFDCITKTTNIDYVSLDVEGAEMVILDTIDFNKYNISILSIENNFNDDRLRVYMEARGYIFDREMFADNIFYKRTMVL